MAAELTGRGLKVERQKRIQVYYRGIAVGEYFADLVVEDTVILEIKAAEHMHEAFAAQLTNYLRATQCEVGFVFNFGPKPEFRRRYFSNRKKKHGPHPRASA